MRTAAARRLFSLHHEGVRLPRVARVAAALAGLAGETESLLDVGAGDGRVGEALAEALGARVEGVDVHLQHDCKIPTRRYDGVTLPFGDASFDVVALADVLHHAARPTELLTEALRVARRAVVVKDHFANGPLSNAMLLLLDVVGNASQGILVRGRYFTRASFRETVSRAGGRVDAEVWPLHVHGPWLRLVTRSELQFAARIVRREGGAGT